MSLTQARAKREEAKALLAAGRDPSGPAPEERPTSGPTFGEVMGEWLEAQEAAWSPAHAVRTRSRLKTNVLPDLGPLPIAGITAPVILATLRKIEERGAVDIAKRAHQSISAVFRYAVASGRAERDPSADLRGALKPSPKVRNMAALRERDLPEFFRRLRSYQGEARTRDALEFIVHTFVRTNELMQGRWSEIEGDLWRIPAERMKMDREHLVPLSPQALAILERLRSYSAGDRIAPMSQNTMIYAMYRMGYHSRATVHGFRSTASTILNESGLWSPDAIERQLAHVPANKVRSAYNAAQYLPERRRMMEWYSARLEALGSV